MERKWISVQKGIVGFQLNSIKPKWHSHQDSIYVKQPRSEEWVMASPGIMDNVPQSKALVGKEGEESEERVEMHLVKG